MKWIIILLLWTFVGMCTLVHGIANKTRRNSTFEKVIGTILMGPVIPIYLLAGWVFELWEYFDQKEGLFARVLSWIFLIPQIAIACPLIAIMWCWDKVNNR